VVNVRGGREIEGSETPDWRTGCGTLPPSASGAADGSSTVRALSVPQVEQIVGRFDDLNPFDPALVPHVWKAEHDSLRRPISCWAVSTKRYALFTRRASEGDLVYIAERDLGERTDQPDETIEDWSEHGLGLYVDPIGRHGARPNRDAAGKRIWMIEAWQYVLSKALGRLIPRPDWANLPALTQFTISSPHVIRWFDGRDRNRPYSERIRPGAFGLIAQAAELSPTRDVLPAAPYEADPAKWADLEWYDRRSGSPISVTTADPVTDPRGFARDVERGAIRIRTLGDVVDGYTRRPEYKSLAPDGTPVTATTAGRLRRRPIRSVPCLTKLAGKEGNRLLERVMGVVVDPTEYRTEFGSRADPWTELVLPVLRAIGTTEIVARTSGAWRSSIERALSRKVTSRRKVELRDIAATYAAERLKLDGIAPGADELVTLADFQRLGLGQRLCNCGCRRAVPSSRSRWYSDACRKRADRHSQAFSTGEKWSGPASGQSLA
jgi:hypothetical protein